jgi:CheY-like chemotaxis protein
VTETLAIVIVEDDVLIAMDLADLLIGMGHDVRAVARTEAEAVAAAATHRPGLMIVDGHLAEGSGVSAMRRILALGFVPHVYVTGDPLGNDSLPADAIIVGKPFSFQGLMGGIASARRAAPGLAALPGGAS